MSGAFITSVWFVYYRCGFSNILLNPNPERLVYLPLGGYAIGIIYAGIKKYWSIFQRRLQVSIIFALLK
jgi:hypothetical protein